jgi:hypothetical protein
MLEKYWKNAGKMLGLEMTRYSVMEDATAYA